MVVSRYDAAEFGNAVVTLAGGGIRVRLVRDRGSVVVDICSIDDPEQWSPLQRALKTFLGSSSPPEMVLTPTEAAMLVEQYYDDLKNAYSPKLLAETNKKLVGLGREAERAFLLRGRTRTN